MGWALDNVDKYPQGFLFIFGDFRYSACLFQPIYFPLGFIWGIRSARVVKIMISTLGNISFQISNMRVEKLLSKKCANKTQGVVILCTSLHIGDGDGDLVGLFATFSEKGTCISSNNLQKQETRKVIYHDNLQTRQKER